MKLLIAGDFVPISRVRAQVETEDYSCFSKTIPIVRQADYSILNFECPVVKESCKPISKIGPALSCSERAVDAIKSAGFNCVTLANNHFRDFGDKGVEDTLQTLEQYEIDYVGGGRNKQEAGQTLYKKIGDISLAIINCCEHEFSIATDENGGSNALNPVRQYYEIKEAKKKADRVIVIVHGGHENYQLPSPRMQETYRFFIDAGADAVVNHHQHCYSGYEVYKTKPIFYGLGNFCFDQLFSKTANTWFEGYMVLLDFSNINVVFELIPYTQCKESPGVIPGDSVMFKRKISELNNIISNPISLKEHFARLCDNRGKDALVNVLSPSGNRYVLGLIRRHLLPSFITKKKILKALSYVNCESHKDILLGKMTAVIKDQE